MAHWNDKHREHIKALLDNCNPFLVGMTSSGIITQDIPITQKYDIIIGYCKDIDMYAIWNGYLHVGKGRVSIPIDKKIEALYTPLNNKKRQYEKKIIVPSWKIDEVCSHWEEFLMPNCKDEEFFPGCAVVWADRENPEPFLWSDLGLTDCDKEDQYRQKIISEKLERNPQFRRKVLDDYDYQCAVCRCKICAILEAHHIVYVADNGSDNLQNGICLCRNHHKMVHEGLIKLDLKEMQYTIDESIQEDDSIKNIINIHQSLMIPKSRRKRK